MLRVSDTGADSCSLGPHCEALALKADAAAYRRAHPRVSETSDTTATASSPLDVSWGRPAEGATLFDLFTDAMERLERINPPPE